MSKKKTGATIPLASVASASAAQVTIKADGLVVFQPDEKIVEGKGQKEREQNFRNEDTGEEKNSYAGQNAEGRVKRRALAVGAAAPHPGQNGQGKDTEGQGQMGGKYVVSEEVIIGGGQPIRQRRLFQVADAIHFQE